MTWGHSGGVLFKPLPSLGETCDFQQTMILKFNILVILRNCISGGRALPRGLNSTRGNVSSSPRPHFPSMQSLITKEERAARLSACIPAQSGKEEWAARLLSANVFVEFPMLPQRQLCVGALSQDTARAANEPKCTAMGLGRNNTRHCFQRMCFANANRNRTANTMICVQGHPTSPHKCVCCAFTKRSCAP